MWVSLLWIENYLRNTDGTLVPTSAVTHLRNTDGTLVPTSAVTHLRNTDGTLVSTSAVTHGILTVPLFRQVQSHTYFCYDTLSSRATHRFIISSCVSVSSHLPLIENELLQTLMKLVRFASHDASCCKECRKLYFIRLKKWLIDTTDTSKILNIILCKKS